MTEIREKMHRIMINSHYRRFASIYSYLLAFRLYALPEIAGNKSIIEKMRERHLFYQAKLRGYNLDEIISIYSRLKLNGRSRSDNCHSVNFWAKNDCFRGVKIGGYHRLKENMRGCKRAVR
jgi:hypothetical protein